MHINLKLFLAFFRIGGLTFGGGYAMLPMLEREVVSRYGWASEQDLMDYYAISQCTPGVIAVNVASLVGAKQGGVVGSFAATAGVITPSFLIITILAGILQQISHLPLVAHALVGIRVAVCALVLKSILKIIKASVVDLPCAVLLAASFLLVLTLNLSPVWIVVAGALYGLLVGAYKRRRV